ncbi:hypothetical protein HUK65_16230 [Rhodobacteraceae bacterium 2376]|uniref:Uncharacterized protein n=1 Tax=Rhabdonatronobacter sediminivivens TaxID=2743469 RepID=A0A7Z0I2W0_9RHOB|nr:hypothetical protein [Rhabdonatronobacter sediminivivens]NYS26534.1 hypothetical protein [Rhabdonatronobacter sediminivivens]
MRPLFRTLLPLALSALILAPQPADARQMQCAARERVLDVLQDRLDQTVRARGLAGQTVMELFVGTDSGDWTLTVTLPNGMTCLLANGQGFTATDDMLAARGAPV